MFSAFCHAGIGGSAVNFACCVCCGKQALWAWTSAPTAEMAPQGDRFKSLFTTECTEDTEKSAYVIKTKSYFCYKWEIRADSFRRW